MVTFAFMGKRWLACTCLLLLASLGCAQEASRNPNKPGAGTPVNPITDLMLIYDVGEGRLPWTVDRFKPYVYRDVDGKLEWLYDGFLFLDPLAKSGRRLCPITNRKDAAKSDWQDLMDHYFQDGQSISALDELLDSLAANGHKPARKRMVVIALPTPMTGSDPNRIVISSEWGGLNGKRLDFNQAANRLKAAQWYVDEVIKRWSQKHYRHLELAGFYWLFERAWKVHHTKEIGQYINALGSRLYWIPSWPQGRSNWQEYGFNFVYQQPNYFFHRKPTPISRLEEACQFADSWGTSMELEFNKDLLTKPAFLNYFDQYLQTYAKHDVWEKRPVAYYEGAGAWFDMANSHDPAVSSRFKALADIVAKRQEKADTGFVFRQDAK
jgi:hypothetical protein